MLTYLRHLLRRRRRDASRWRITAERAQAMIDAAAGEADPIGSAVARGLAAIRLPRPAPAGVVTAARAHFSKAALGSPEAALAQIIAYVEAFPNDERLQVLAGRMLDRSTLRGKGGVVWSGIGERFPDAAGPLGTRGAAGLRSRFSDGKNSRITSDRSIAILALASTEADPVGAAVARGLAAGRAKAVPTLSTLKAVSRFFSRGTVDQSDSFLAELLSFVESFPSDERLQVYAGRMLERSSLHEAAAVVWEGINERFPGSATGFQRRIGHMTREKGVEATHSWLLDRFPDLPTERTDLIAYAAGFSQINEFDQADRAYEALLALCPREEWAYTLYADSLERRGEHDLARQLLEQGLSVDPSETSGIEKRFARLDDRYSRIRLRFPELTTREAISNRGVLELFMAQIARGRPSVSPPRSSLGRTLLVTGSLGAGGAERQFVTTALRLQTACQNRSDRDPDDAGKRHAVEGPIGVLCRSLTSRPGADFFLPLLKAADLPVVEIESLPASRGYRPGSVLEPHARFLDFLSPQIADTAVQLADELRSIGPEVIHIWQDGMVLKAAAAALIAGVPRIVLSVRTMPPIDRLGRKKPEYETLYRCLIDTPGVVVTANSKRAADRYAEWLGVDPGRIAVIHNGVAPLPAACEDTTAAVFELFDAATQGASFTVGSVMRFDENKRPGPWLETAALVLRAVPDARFILVGDGPLLKQAKDKAEDLGIAERVLFAGRSPHVGFWLTRMDVLLLLSRIEGLPNVLIEAQFAGVPVVTTPAGGAVETIVAGETGEVLPSELAVDPTEAAAILVALAADPERRERMSRAAEAFAAANFSVETMIARTIETYLA